MSKVVVESSFLVFPYQLQSAGCPAETADCIIEAVAANSCSQACFHGSREVLHVMPAEKLKFDSPADAGCIKSRLVPEMAMNPVWNLFYIKE